MCSILLYVCIIIIVLTYPHTMHLVHIDPDWSMDTKVSHVLERISDVHLTAWH